VDAAIDVLDAVFAQSFVRRAIHATPVANVA
jgi:hypothetical protein